jgi:signal transduction histidine kinase
MPFLWYKSAAHGCRAPAGGTITVRLAQHNDMARVSISDQGIGVPADAMPRLFQRFYRADNADPRHISGMGVGLYVVREILQLHGGHVEVESVEGSGSTFTVVLPLLADREVGANNA